jgi:enoyl-CoA hydratase/carnithine racemase
VIRWWLQDGIYELELGRAPCNEIGTTMLAELERFLAAIDTEAASALIMYSTCKGGFSAGADLRELYAGLLDVPEKEKEPRLRDFIDRIHVVMDTIDMLPLTTIAVVHGVCFGGGFELALTADVIIAERSARFAFPELRLGIVPGFGGIPRLRRDVSNGATAAQCTKFDPDARRTCKRFLKPLPREQLAEEKEHFIRLAKRPVLQAALKKFVESDDVRPYLP